MDVRTLYALLVISTVVVLMLIYNKENHLSQSPSIGKGINRKTFIRWVKTYI